MFVVIQCDIIFQNLEGPSQPHLSLFLFTVKSLAIIFYLKHAKTKITVKVLKIIEHTFRNKTYSKTIRFHFTMQ